MTAFIRTAKSVASPAVRRLRQQAARRRAGQGPHGVCLLYHRIASPQADPWHLSVSEENFREQLEVLKEFGRGLAFRDFVHDLTGPSPSARSFSVTFDDGYLDNLTAALPVLEQARVPATIFVTSGTIGAGRDFWWDALVRVFLTGAPLPSRLTLTIAGRRCRWAITRPASTELSNTLGGWYQNRVRQSVLLSIWRTLQPRPDAEIQAAMNHIMDWAGMTRVGASADRPLDLQELRRLAASPLVEIGAHTLTHPPLARIAKTDRAREIGQSRSDLEQMIGQPVTSFSYPYGNHDAETVHQTRAAGFRCACTVEEDIMTVDTDPFRIPRLQVRDWTGDMFLRVLRAYTGFG